MGVGLMRQQVTKCQSLDVECLLGWGGERTHIFMHSLASDWTQVGLVEESKEGDPRRGKSEARP